VAKLLSLIISAIVGASLAGVAVAGVVSSSTAAPKSNPASAQIVDYGNR
jgi:hypothetical protein